ncbi:MAG: hypothetical protein ACREJ0_13790 [Geminicoccaceae bacterium]
MRIITSVTATTAVLAVTLMLSAAPPPAQAGRACNELGLSSPCVRGSDLKANIIVEEDGRNARLRLRDAAGDNGVELSAATANLTNLFSNDQDASNGLVKAWARINDDGTIEACWRCNKDPNVTRRIQEGFYEVDFTPLATDISGRPMSGSILNSGLGQLVLFNNNANLSSILVTTFFSAIEDRAFVVLIY